MKYVLISDGSSDRALIPIINYTLKKCFNHLDFDGKRAEISQITQKNVRSLEEKIKLVIEYYDDASIIFIHRDAENQHFDNRVNEVDRTLNKFDSSKLYAKIIPIRMTEAWLLIDEKSIRKAAANPNGKAKLNLPKVDKLETLPNPKAILENLLKEASGLTGRRLRDFNTRQSIQLIPEYLEDFSKLNQLSSYIFFKNEVEKLFLH